MDSAKATKVNELWDSIDVDKAPAEEDTGSKDLPVVSIGMYSKTQKWQTNSQRSWTTYSYLPNNQAGLNNQAGWIISRKLINKQVQLDEQGGIFLKNSINEQAWIREQVGIMNLPCPFLFGPMYQYVQLNL